VCYTLSSRYSCDAWNNGRNLLTTSVGLLIASLLPFIVSFESRPHFSLSADIRTVLSCSLSKET